MNQPLPASTASTFRRGQTPIVPKQAAQIAQQVQDAPQAQAVTQAFPADLPTAIEALDRVVDAVRRDALTASTEYLAASEVPHGGE
ncbi:MAG: hypothetical protein U1A77_17935 [Pirellulales bacterium]